MNAVEVFDARIAAIHGLSAGGKVMDIRHEEFIAMADAFLGAEFDRVKLAQVEALQLTLHETQFRLSRQLSALQIDRTRYVDEVNQLHAHIAQQCESVLGLSDFQKLFGVTPAEVGAYIDKEQVLAQA